MNERQVFAYRILILVAAATIWVTGKAAGFKEAERLFVKGAEFGRTSHTPAR